MVGIYKIRNKINGKIYIGQSIKIEERWKSHILNSRQEKITDSSQVIHKAINKYGVENFEFSILEECDEAARVMNLTKYSIADCCRGRQKTSAGYIWKYL